MDCECCVCVRREVVVGECKVTYEQHEAEINNDIDVCVHLPYHPLWLP